MTGFEAATFGHVDGFLIGEGNAEPGIVGRGAGARIALHFEFEEAARAEEAADFAHVILDDFLRRNVMEAADGKGEVEEFGAGQDGEVHAVVVPDGGVGRVGAGAFGERGHFGADVDGVYKAEETGEGFGDAARAEGAGFVSDQSLLESTM